MKKLILGVAVMAMALVACGGKKTTVSIVGSWVMPVEGQPGKVQGITMEEGGDAYSINTVSYTHLDVYKRQLLTGRRASCLRTG